jgi:hypothetical protein
VIFTPPLTLASFDLTAASLLQAGRYSVLEETWNIHPDANDLYCRAPLSYFVLFVSVFLFFFLFFFMHRLNLFSSPSLDNVESSRCAVEITRK